MIVITSSEIVGKEITATFGMVRGTTVRARHIGKDILAIMRNIVGGEVVVLPHGWISTFHWNERLSKPRQNKDHR